MFYSLSDRWIVYFSPFYDFAIEILKCFECGLLFFSFYYLKIFYKRYIEIALACLYDTVLTYNNDQCCTLFKDL